MPGEFLLAADVQGAPSHERRYDVNRDWDDDSDDDFDVDAVDDEGEPTVPCPYCGEEIHEDSQRCPHCEQYVSDVDAPPRKKPWWIIIGVVVCLYIVYRWSWG